MTPSSTVLSRIAEAESLYEADVHSRHLAIRKAHDFSLKRLAAVRDELRGNPPSNDLRIHVLATAGSLARMEAAAVSDLDVIMTTDHGGDASIDEKAIAWRNELCDRLQIERPNPIGVFSRPIDRSVIENTSGGSNESYDSVAKRVLFLLESQWLLNQDDYNALVSKIVDAYAADVMKDPRKNFVFLLNDVIRYFRTICVNYQFTTTDTVDGKWTVRNVKLRHSRVLMYFSMVAAIGSLSREHSEQKVEALKAFVSMPPLKRLYVAYALANDGSFYRVAGFYNTFLHLLSSNVVRDELKGVDYDHRYDSPAFAQLKANSDALSNELLRFYDARRNTWDERFFEYMLV